MLFAGTTRIGTREKDHLIVSHNLNFMRHKDNSKIQTSTMTVYLVTLLDATTYVYSMKRFISYYIT